MTVQEIILKLKEMSQDKYKQNVVKMGIPAESSIGVSTGDVRQLAKKIGKSNQLGRELWQSGYHEAKLLAVLIFDKKSISIEDIKQLMPDVQSWDLCDHLCKNLIVKIKGYEEIIPEWIDHKETYFKRAAFTMIATDVIHNKKIFEETLQSYLRYIYEYSQDERAHVKKAVSWALREIGKKNFDYNEKAILLAHELLETGNKSQVWIARDALKELENLVKVEGRERLISTHSKMGKEK